MKKEKNFCSRFLNDEPLVVLLKEEIKVSMQLQRILLKMKDT